VDTQWYVIVLAPYAQSLNSSAVPFKDKSGNPVTVAGGTSFVIPAGAKNPNAACAWMTSLVTDDAWSAAGAARAAKIAATPGAINTGLFTGSPSADKLIREKFVKPSGNAGFDETISTFYDVLPNGKTLGASPAGQAIKTELKNAVASALLGEKTAEKALADAQAAAKRAFDQAAS
jgi:multiple sugar transport system substrate-binding protein